MKEVKDHTESRLRKLARCGENLECMIDNLEDGTLSFIIIIY